MASEYKTPAEHGYSSDEKDPEMKTMHHKTDADAALDFLRGRDTGTVVTVDQKKLLRKIDFMIIPLMWGCYCLQYLDKTLINYANVMGLSDDAHLVGNEYSYLALIFYISYLVFEFPHGYAMQRFPTAKYLGAMVTCWGICVAATSGCTNYASLVALRVLLGIFESAVAPALILISSMWYKRSEQPPRVGLWYCGVGTGTIFGSLISFGFQHYGGRTFYSWQIMFLVVGLITVAVGITVMFFLPDNPMSSRLSREEKIVAIERVRENQTGIENKHFKAYQVRECFADPQTWLLILIVTASNIPNGAVSSYQATIIKSFGYTSKETALLSIPSGVISIVSILIATWLAGRYNARGLQIILLLIPGGVLGGALLAFLPDNNKAGKLIGNYLTNCIGTTIPLNYSWVAANYAGHTKKVTMNAILLMSFCLGNILGPLSFQAKDKPEYIPAKITIIASCVAAIIFTAMLMAYYKWENARRDKAGVGMSKELDDQEFLDLTDRENKAFRYRL